MRNILLSDFFKLRKNKYFWGCTFASVVLAIIFVAAIHSGVLEEAVAVDGRGSAEMLAQILFTGFNIFLIAAFVPLFVASEFHHGTIKNTLSRGAKRTEVFISKFVVCTCANLIIMAAFICTVLALGTIFWGFDPNDIGAFSGLLIMIPLQALMIIAYTALFTFTSIILRGTAGAMVTNLASLMVLSLVLNSISALFSESFSLADYWIGWGVNNLATLTPAYGDVIQGVMIALAWIAVSITAGTVLFKKVDVK